MTSWADELDEEEKQQPQRDTNAWKKGNPWGINVQKKEEAPQKPAHVDDSDFPLPGKDKAPREAPSSNGRANDRVEERRDERRDDYRRNERRDDYRRDDRRDDREPPRRDDFRREERRDFPRREFYGHDDREGREDRRSSEREDRRSSERDDRGRGRGGFGKPFNRREREPRDSKPREPIPLPTQAPFTAFVGNLPFSVVPDDLHQFFNAENCKVAHIRIIADPNGKPKGYGYVEFEDLESLKSAVALDGQSLFDRQLKIDVAEAKPKQEDRPWKKRDSSPAREERTSTSSGSAEPPKERPKIALQPRSEAPKPAAPSDAYKSAKSNPFGEAKPRDELEILKKKEEERKQREVSSPKDEPETEEVAKTEEKPRDAAPREEPFKTATRNERPPRREDRPPRRDDERGPRRDDRPPRRDDNRGPRRDDERGPRRDDNRGPRRDDNRGPRRDDERGPRRDDKPRNQQPITTSVPAAKRAPWAPKQEEAKEVQSANAFALLQEEDL